MFEEILNAVKNELGGHPAIAGNVTPEQEAAIHDEIARHINNTAGTSSSGGGILSNLQQAISSGGTATNAIEGGLIGSLTSRFGLPPAVTGAIAAALPGLLQKFAARQQE
ncbi:hypothetical protein LQ567_21195 [Niabella pedocola]|uniref:DUF937 domain-containing protein n=1 Tax=Niabella pedocola TaxID=1752077 RepID=A0ABS8PZF5_9BACT|nr:hypothetical protein [Niabella pedocola]MCD2425316.1 hypothetical protein [Niabella pedocola]